MNKQELIAAAAVRAGLGRADAARAVDALIETIVATLAAGHVVRIVGFGSFAMTRRKPFMGRNPRTGAVIAIPATVHARFRPGTRLKAIR